MSLLQALDELTREGKIAPDSLNKAKEVQQLLLGAARLLLDDEDTRNYLQ